MNDAVPTVGFVSLGCPKAPARPVPDALKQERHDALMALQARISADKLKKRIGKTLTVLVDQVEAGNAVGRSYADAPEIDGVVYVEGSADARAGDWVEVVVTGADQHDLYARPLSPPGA
jgi:ribosomal protein S12 methylthiotransferase